MKTLLLLGATGLVGHQVLTLALGDSGVARLVAPTRRPLPAHPRLDNPIVDYEALPADAPWWHADAVICTLGTTLKLAGSQAAFRRVDHDYIVEGARLARAAGTPAAAVVSSLGAAVDGASFYLRVKGETERDLAALGFDSLTLVRPSLIDGGPRPESRPAESAGLVLARLAAPLLPKRWRPVQAAAIARTLVAAALAADPGRHVVESDALQPA